MRHRIDFRRYPGPSSFFYRFLLLCKMLAHENIVARPRVGKGDGPLCLVRENSPSLFCRGLDFLSFFLLTLFKFLISLAFIPPRKTARAKKEKFFKQECF